MPLKRPLTDYDRRMIFGCAAHVAPVAWVSVKDRLPHITLRFEDGLTGVSNHVLVCGVSNDGAAFVTVDLLRSGFDGDTWWGTQGITHWQRIEWLPFEVAVASLKNGIIFKPQPIQQPLNLEGLFLRQKMTHQNIFKYFAK